MTTQTSSGRGTGVIHNIGYRGYDGLRLGRYDVAMAVYSQTLRGSYGLGRGIASKLFPWFLVFCTMLPAFILVAIGSITGNMPLEPTQYTFFVQMIPAMFIAWVAPQAMSRDLRFGTLSLYFSRPLTYRDYVLAKLAGLWTAVFALLTAPLLLLYLGGLLTGLKFTDTSINFVAATASVAMLACLYTAIGALIASVTPRRGLGVGAILAFLVGSYGFANVLQVIMYELEGANAGILTGLLSPITIYDAVQSFLFNVSMVLPGLEPSVPVGLTMCAALVGFTALSVWLLMLRYKKVSTS